MFNGFSQSVMGASHEKTGLVCQDSSAFKVADNYAIAVVADGHGSKKHFRSHIGSKYAVESTIEAIDRFYEDADEFEANFPKNHKMILRNIEKQIIANWNTKVSKHLEENPVTPEERSKFTDEEFEKLLVNNRRFKAEYTKILDDIEFQNAIQRQSMKHSALKYRFNTLIELTDKYAKELC